MGYAHPGDRRRGLALILWIEEPKTIGELLLIYYNGITQFVPGVFAALIWPKANVWGVAAGLLVGLSIAVYLANAQLSLGGVNTGFIALIANFVVMVVVSLADAQEAVIRLRLRKRLALRAAFFWYLAVLATVAWSRGEAIAAVDWFVAARIERNLGGPAAVAAGCGEHFARTSAAIAATAAPPPLAPLPERMALRAWRQSGHRFGLFWKPFCA